MCNTWNNETVIDFINEVHTRPELWDVKTGVYKDKNAKKDGWAVIAEKFNITSDEAYKKFRSLRTYAHNEEKRKKSGSAGGKQIKWFVFEAISFLLTQNAAKTGTDSEISATTATTSNVIETTDAVVIAESEGSLESLNKTPKLRAKRSKTDPFLDKAQNIIRDASEKKRNEYSAFGEHVANKLMKYDDYTRAHAELKIMQILFECEMQRTRATSTTLSSPYNSSTSGAGTPQTRYSDLSTPPLQNNVQYITVPKPQDVTPNQTQVEHV